MHKIKLTYFKRNGKYYSEGEYESTKEYLWEAWIEIEQMRDKRKLLGLMEGHSSNFIVSVDAVGYMHNHPHLVV